MLFARHRLALLIALIVSGSLGANANAVETIIADATYVSQTLTDIDSLTVLEHGAIIGGETAVNLRTEFSAPFITVHNHGLIISTGSRAIETVHDRGWYAFYAITNYSNGLILGSDAAIRINNHLDPSGYVNLDNSGLISALNGDGVDLGAVTGKYVRTTIVNNEGGMIRGNLGDGIKTGSNADITNRGAILTGDLTSITAEFDGIDNGSATGVKIFNSGLISGGRHGITSNQDVTLSNHGTITGLSGSGVVAKGDGFLNNYGAISGGSLGLMRNEKSDGVRIANIAEIYNVGTIEGTGYTGVNHIGGADSSDGISMGGGYVYNDGTRSADERTGLISGANNGILVDDGNGGSAVAVTRLNNFGVIRGLNGYGVKMTGEFADQVTNGGLISGSNGVALDMGGGDDTLTIRNGGRFEGLVDGGSGRNTLILNRYGYDYEGGGASFGQSRNFASLQVQQGVWTLTGSGDFSEGAHVSSSAKLINQGGIAGDVFVERYGGYGGGGTVSNLNINGTLTTNTLIGAPRVNGNLTMGSGSTLEFGVNANGTAATTHVAGNASLSGSSLSVLFGPGEYPWHSQYTVLEAGSITGTFDYVNGDNYAFLDPKVSYESNRVDVTYTRNDVDMTDYARTVNGARAVGSIQSIYGASDYYWLNWRGQNPLYDALLSTSETTASAAIESLAGSSNANLSSATLQASSQIGTSMLSAMQQMGSGAGLLAELDQSQAPVLAATGVPSAARNLNDPNARGRVWLQGLGSYGKLDGEHGNAGLEQRTAGSLLGVDWSLSPVWHLGVLGGYSKTNLDSHNVDGTLHSWHVGAYALRQDGPLALRLGAAYSRHDGDSKRTVEFEGFSDKPKGNYDADSQQAFAEVGYLLGSGRLNVEPFANLGYQRYHRDGFTEKGGLAALNVDDQTQDNFSSTFGARLAHLNRLENGISLTPRASLGWRHTYGDVDSETRQAFVLGGSAFNVEGSALDRDSLMVEAGVDVGLSARHTLSVGYNGELGSHSRNHALIGQWQMSF